MTDSIEKKYCLCGEETTKIYQCARCGKKCCDECACKAEDEKHYHGSNHPLCNVGLFSSSE